MRLKGIIFDKDGTLFDYYSIWGPVFRSHVERILEEFDRSGDLRLRGRLLHLLGIGDEGINPDGLIFQHNGTAMLLRLFLFSRRNSVPYRRLLKLLTEGYYDSKKDIEKSLKSSGREEILIPLFSALKRSGYRIGVVTSDNSASTKVCLDHFQITDYVDMISTWDDGYRKKPHPESFHAFCRTYGLDPPEVAMVGDAPVDMKYARRAKAGYIVGVLTGSGDRDRIAGYADAIYPTVLELLEDERLQLRE